uniref:Uncharacterized protein n=1 Tax=Rhizophora mucronata TaxID=61149 RepID=A0A2P2QCB0_RHIMU
MEPLTYHLHFALNHNDPAHLKCHNNFCAERY